MCGINLSINTQKDALVVERMNKATSHRGPDGTGQIESKNLALGHVRLSIIDLSESGSQPLFSRDKRYAISFNGEIINFKELSYEFLKEEPINDTSVALKCFLSYGPKWCIENFRGMYAFIIVDLETNNTTLIRDPFGIKPLFYSQIDKRFIASSEIIGIIASKEVPLEIDKRRVYEYLTERHVKAPNTLFTNIKQVRPGEIIEISEI